MAMRLFLGFALVVLTQAQACTSSENGDPVETSTPVLDLFGTAEFNADFRWIDVANKNEGKVVWRSDGETMRIDAVSERGGGATGSFLIIDAEREHMGCRWRQITGDQVSAFCSRTTTGVLRGVSLFFKLNVGQQVASRGEGSHLCYEAETTSVCVDDRNRPTYAVLRDYSLGALGNDELTRTAVTEPAGDAIVPGWVPAHEETINELTFGDLLLPAGLLDP